MPKLKIDNLEIEVPKGTKVIEAADRLGIFIPRFCYHAALGSVGACRMCAVMFGEGPVKGVQMSCMVDAQEGMVVSTQHPDAVAFRKQVVEWLMMNHPHDCPVCDEGGQCLLQDMTVSSGHGIRRYRGKKRTYRDQYLGPLIQHEMNRCIQCYRCSRFYQQFAGYRDLGPMQIAHRVYFGRFTDGALESPFSGNLADVCPTGVYTDKSARFRGRRWDFERGPSICIHCSLGCHTVGSSLYRSVAMIEARFSEAVNGYFICDRGRYGYPYANEPGRPRRARVGKDEVSWGEAVRSAAETLGRMAGTHGPRSVASLASSRTSLENMAALNRLCRARGWRDPEFFETASLNGKVTDAVSRLSPEIAVSLREIEKADFILVAGADPVNEAPMLALALRQAFRNGAAVAVLDPRPVSLPFQFVHAPVPSGEISGYAGALMKRGVERTGIAGLGEEALRFFDSLPEKYPETGFQYRLPEIEKKFRNSRKPVLVCGIDIVPDSGPSLAADYAVLLKEAKGWAGLFYLLPGPNAFGAALLSRGGGSLERIVEEIENGAVRGLLVVENDPFWRFPDRQRLRRALAMLESLVVMDYLPSPAAEMAGTFLPTATVFETGSSWINQEGRLQFAPPFSITGSPVEQVSGGGHPPRVFRPDIPGGEPRPAWGALADLETALEGKQPQSVEASAKNVWSWMKEDHAWLGAVEPFGHPEGLRLASGKKPTLFSSGAPRFPSETAKETFDLLDVDWTFGTEELSSYSPNLRELEKPPCIFVQSQDAVRLRISDKDRLRVLLGGQPLEFEVCALPNMAEGTLIFPRHRQIEWQRLGTAGGKVAVENIKKV